MVRRWRVVSVVMGSALLSGSAVPVMAQEVASDEAVEPDAPVVAVESVVAAEHVAPPRSPQDLPRRSTPDVPQFVGPATLKLSGRHGVYAWDEIRFGAQEVVLRIAAVPRVDACLVRARVREDGETVVDEWSMAASGQKTIARRVAEVDYLTGTMKVVSDCKHWSVSFQPLPDPELPVEIEERYYPVKGDTIAKLASQSQHVKGRWAAYTEWFTTWDWETEVTPDGSACEVTGGHTGLEVRLTYPDWKKPKTVDPEVEGAWQKMLTNLRTHESGHVTIALQGADAIDDRLDRGLTGVSCERVAERADAVATRIFDRYAGASRRYDKKTDHGLAQGTSLG